jgi:hypothetical protein
LYENRQVSCFVVHGREWPMVKKMYAFFWSFDHYFLDKSHWGGKLWSNDQKGDAHAAPQKTQMYWRPSGCDRI